MKRNPKMRGVLSCLLALVLALGATPLAVYADEAQTGISTVSEDPEEKDKDNTNKNPEEKDKDNTDESSEGKDKDKTNEDTEEKDKDKTNEDTEEKDNSNTNEGSEADAPESEEKVAATNGVTPPSADTLGIGGIWNSRSSSFYKDLESATKEAQSGDTL